MPSRYWQHSDYPTDEIRTEAISAAIRDELVPARCRVGDFAKGARDAGAAIGGERSKDDAATRSALAEGNAVKDPHQREHAAKKKLEAANEVLRTARQVAAEIEVKVWRLVDSDLPTLYANALARAEAIASEHEIALVEVARLAGLKQRALEELGTAADALDGKLYDEEYRANKRAGTYRVPNRGGRIPRPITNRAIGVIGWPSSDIYAQLLKDDVGLHMPPPPKPSDQDRRHAAEFASATTVGGRHSIAYVR
jgi:hypothetical protein